VPAKVIVMYVYLIQAGKKKLDPVKVGYSRDPESRLKTLQTGNPVALRILMKIKCNDEAHARRLESTLHEMLGHQNIHYEWFKLKSSHVMKMLTAFANDEKFDQIQHGMESQHYSNVISEISYKKRYSALLAQHKETVSAHAKIKQKLKEANEVINSLRNN
jgi:hypothetical protein